MPEVLQHGREKEEDLSLGQTLARTLAFAEGEREETGDRVSPQKAVGTERVSVVGRVLHDGREVGMDRVAGGNDVAVRQGHGLDGSVG